MDDLTALTIAEIREGLAAGRFSAAELTEAYLAAIEAGNAALNAYIVATPERARDMAAAADQRIKRGEARRLEGVPLGIKDLFCTLGVHSQAASRILEGFKPTY
jgi:aspartyl-tRNA(Asn)/glutamyl-tRNA(Gln) amidotransferase subunit A